MVSKKQDCVICVGWGIYSTVCKLELEFMWKSNVVWDLCGSKDFEKRGQWAQESEIRAIWPLENLKPLYDEEGNFFAVSWIEFKWSLAQARMKFGECICHLVYVFCILFVCALVLCHNPTHSYPHNKRRTHQLTTPLLSSTFDGLIHFSLSLHPPENFYCTLLHFTKLLQNLQFWF